MVLFTGLSCIEHRSLVEKWIKIEKKRRKCEHRPDLSIYQSKEHTRNSVKCILSIFDLKMAASSQNKSLQILMSSSFRHVAEVALMGGRAGSHTT